MLVEGLDKRIKKLATKLEAAKATKDIDYLNGIIREGIVAGQHHEWTAWEDGASLVFYLF